MAEAVSPPVRHLTRMGPCKIPSGAAGPEPVLGRPETLRCCIMAQRTCRPDELSMLAPIDQRTGQLSFVAQTFCAPE